MHLDYDPYYHGLIAHVPKFAHPTRQANLIRITNPPIVRRAMNKRLWNGNNNNSYQPQMPAPLPNYSPFFTSNDAGHYRYPSNPINGLSTFDPMTILAPMSARYMKQPAQQPPNTDNQLINDNNEIYGVNPSLIRKNTQLFPRSTSTPSLKNIFSRKKNKDYNNNNNNKNSKNNSKSSNDALGF